MAADLTCPQGHKMPPPSKRGRNVYVLCVRCGKKYRFGQKGYIAKSGRGLVRVSLMVEAEQAEWLRGQSAEAKRAALQRGIDSKPVRAYNE